MPWIDGFPYPDPDPRTSKSLTVGQLLIILAIVGVCVLVATSML